MPGATGVEWHEACRKPDFRLVRSRLTCNRVRPHPTSISNRSLRVDVHFAWAVSLGRVGAPDRARERILQRNQVVVADILDIFLIEAVSLLRLLIWYVSRPPIE